MELTNTIAKSYPNHNCGFICINSESTTTEVFRRLSYQFSSALSTRAVASTPNLLGELAQFYNSFSLEYKQVMLEMIEPWAKNFPKVLAISEEGGVHMLSHLLKVTTESLIPFHTNILEKVWQNTADGQDHTTRTLTTFLLNEYTKSKHPDIHPCIDISMCKRKHFFHTVFFSNIIKKRFCENKFR